MRDLIIDIQNDILLGILGFADIARKYEVPVSWVNEAWDMLCEQEAQAAPDSYLESMYEDQYDLGDY